MLLAGEWNRNRATTATGKTASNDTVERTGPRAEYRTISP